MAMYRKSSNSCFTFFFGLFSSFFLLWSRVKIKSCRYTPNSEGEWRVSSIVQLDRFEFKG